MARNHSARGGKVPQLSRLTLSQRRRRSGTASVSAGTVGTRIGALAPDPFAVGSGLNDSVWAAHGVLRFPLHGGAGPDLDFGPDPLPTGERHGQGQGHLDMEVARGPTDQDQHVAIAAAADVLKWMARSGQGEFNLVFNVADGGELDRRERSDSMERAPSRRGPRIRVGACRRPIQ